MLWRKDSCVLYVGQQGDGSTFNCLVNRKRTETECSFVLNIHIVKCVGPSYRGHSSEVEVEVEVEMEGVWFL